MFEKIKQYIEMKQRAIVHLSWCNTNSWIEYRELQTRLNGYGVVADSVERMKEFERAHEAAQMELDKKFKFWCRLYWIVHRFNH